MYLFVNPAISNLTVPSVSSVRQLPHCELPPFFSANPGKICKMFEIMASQWIDIPTSDGGTFKAYLGEQCRIGFQPVSGRRGASPARLHDPWNRCRLEAISAHVEQKTGWKPILHCSPPFRAMLLGHPSHTIERGLLEAKKP
jgi:hypothetical protein